MKILKQKKFVLPIVYMLLFLTAAIVYIFFSGDYSAEPDGTVTFTFLNIGQGDASLISSPAGNLLIDTGPDNAENNLTATLSGKNIETIRMLFLTHGDSDHAGGADAVLRSFHVDTLFLPQSDILSASARAAVHTAKDRGTAIRYLKAGDILYSGDIELRVLSPFDPPEGEENTDSLVLFVRHQKNGVLLMGDADIAAEQRILEREADSLPVCNLLKTGHHGSRTSTSEAFLNAVCPEYAVISCGKANAFGHPHSETLARLQNHNVTVLRTDEQGEIRFVSDGTDIRPETE